LIGAVKTVQASQKFQRLLQSKKEETKTEQKHLQDLLDRNEHLQQRLSEKGVQISDMKERHAKELDEVRRQREHLRFTYFEELQANKSGYIDRLKHDNNKVLTTKELRVYVDRYDSMHGVDPKL